MREGYKRLNKTKLSNRKHSTISTVEALKDIAPIQWSESILQGTSKVQIDKRGIQEVCVSS